MASVPTRGAPNVPCRFDMLSAFNFCCASSVQPPKTHHVNHKPLLPQIQRRKRSQGSPERVSRRNDSVRRVRRVGRFNRRAHRSRNLGPSIQKTSCALTARAQIRRRKRQVQIREVVAPALAAAEGDDDEVVGGVDGDEAACVGTWSALSAG
jgi:hypothetical protein